MLLPVAGPERTAVRSDAIGQAADVRAVAVHRVDLHVAVADAGEGDAPVGGDRRFGVVARRRGERLQAAAVGVRHVDVVAVVDGPDVAARVGRLRRARGAAGVGAGVDDALPIGREIAAGRAPRAGRHAVHAGAVDVHHVLLIAAAAVPRRLENQLPAVGREVGFGVLAAERELLDVAQPRLGCGRAADGSGGPGRRLLRGHQRQHRDEDAGGGKEHVNTGSHNRNTLADRAGWRKPDAARRRARRSEKVSCWADGGVAGAGRAGERRVGGDRGGDGRGAGREGLRGDAAGAAAGSARRGGRSPPIGRRPRPRGRGRRHRRRRCRARRRRDPRRPSAISIS